MLLLVVNDDGPPSNVSPYFLPFVQALQGHGHRIQVVIPDKPMSWIGKAHAVGQDLCCTRICPFESYMAEKTCPAASEKECEQHRWNLLNGSPASCAQIGLYHCGWKAEDFDMVISGPNHGRNASTIYNLSSGTVGGALEAALCGKRSISLSFGSKELQPDERIAAACERSVRIIEQLKESWNEQVELYNINLPMVDDLLHCRAVFTQPTRSRWSKGSLFKNVLSKANVNGHGEEGIVNHSDRTVFRWQPELSDVQRAADTSGEYEDLWASQNKIISITGFQANFVTAGQNQGDFLAEQT